MLLNGTGEYHGGRGKKRPYEEVSSNGAAVVTKSSRRELTAGVIKKIKLKDFMSHAELEWDPCTNVHFVTGANGSGKSSILQALVLGLNGDIKTIKRYQKPKEFIKKDCQKAIIQITLANGGEDSYKPEKYGAELTIQRTISESSSTFCLKDAQFKDVAFKGKGKETKEEIKRILEKFQIQIDSPIVILHQETAKELLKIESPRNLYSFFEKSTLLKHCQDETKEAENQMAMIKVNLQEKQRSYKHITSEFSAVKKKCDERKKRLNMNKEFNETKGDYAWARVHEARLVLEKGKEELKALEAKKKVPAAKIKKMQEECQDFKAQAAELSVTLDEENAKYQQQEEELESLRENLQLLKETQNENNNRIRTENVTKNSLDAELKYIQTQITNLSKAENLAEKERLEQIRQMELETLNARKAALEKEKEREDLAREVQDREMQQEKLAKSAEQQNLKKIESQIQDVQRELDEMGSSSEQHLAVFGSKIPQLDREIKRNLNRFHKPPIGPLGAHIKLEGEAGTNTELGRLIETEIGRHMLSCYLTNDDNDRRELLKIVNSVFGMRDPKKPKIYTSRFLGRRHNVTRPGCREKALMDYLKIENANVFNHLVDQKSIESILVCRTQETAKALMTYEERVPRNVQYTITHDFNRFFPAKKNASYRSYYIEPIHGAVTLKSTMSSIVQEKSKELRSLQESCHAMREEINKKDRSLQSFAAEKKRASDNIQRIRMDLKKVSTEITKVKAACDNDSGDQLDNLRAEYQIKKENLQEINNNIQSSLDKKAETGRLLKEKDAELKRKRDELNKAKADSELAESNKSLRALENKINRKGKEIKNQEKIQKKLTEMIEDKKRKVKEHEKIIKEFSDIGSKIKEEFVPDKSAKELNAKFMNLKEKLETKKDGEDVEELQKNYTELFTKHAELNSEIQALQENFLIIQQMQKDRKVKMIFIRRHITNIVRRKFNELIKRFAKKLGCEILLRINHENKNLTFVFKNGEEERSNTDVSTLSGGEKSYTQMCLICALWDMMEPPFRCLDEWDVFLDSVNRKDIARELLEFSLKKLDKQFIFISPQGATDVKNIKHPLVKITEIKKNS